MNILNVPRGPRFISRRIASDRSIAINTRPYINNLFVPTVVIRRHEAKRTPRETLRSRNLSGLFCFSHLTSPFKFRSESIMNRERVHVN